MTAVTAHKTISAEAQDDAVAIGNQIGDRKVVAVTLELDDGTKICVKDRLADVLSFVTTSLSKGNVKIGRVPNELTTRTAADLLGVSRPTVMKMIRDGLLPSHRVGTHHRFMFKDVDALRRKRAADRSRAIEELRRLELEESIEG